MFHVRFMQLEKKKKHKQNQNILTIQLIDQKKTHYFLNKKKLNINKIKIYIYIYIFTYYINKIILTVSEEKHNLLCNLF